MSALVGLLLLLAAPDDAADLKAVVEKFFAAAMAKDASAAGPLWSPKAPQRAVILECVADHPDDLADGGAGPFTIQGDEAVATVRFKGRLTSVDGVYADEKTMRWRVSFRREGGSWMWWDFQPAGAALATEVVALEEKKDRDALIRARKEEIGLRMISVLTTAMGELATTGEIEAGWHVAAAALEAAELADRDDLRASVFLAWGVGLATQSKPGEAIPMLKKSVACAEKVQDWEAASLAHTWLGFSLMDSNALGEAPRELDVARDQAVKSGDAETLFMAQNFTGMLQARRGSPLEALQWHDRAAATAEKAERPDLLIQALHEIGRVRWDAGDYGGALAATMRGLALADKPDDVPVRAKLLNTMGLIYLSTGQYAKSRERLEQALELWSTLRLPRMAGVMMSNLGELHRLEKNYPEAVARMKEAIRVLEEAGDRPMAAAGHNNLGLIYRFQGDPDAALAEYRACADTAKDVRMDNLRVAALVNIADIQLLKGFPGFALKTSEEALTVAEQQKSPSLLFMAQLAVGQSCLRRKGKGDLDRAVEALRRAAAALEGSRSGLRDPALQQSFLSQHAPLYGLLADVLHVQKRDPEAFAVSEEAKARTLMDLLQSGSVRIVKAMTAEERGEEERRDAELRALLRQLEGTRLTDERTAIEERIGRSREALEEYRRGVFARHPELEGLRGRFTPASLEELHRKLLSGTPKTGVISYLQGPTGLFAFVLTPGRETASLSLHEIPGKIEELREKADALWAACSAAGGEYRAPARALYDLLIAPAEPALALADVKHLVLIPDGFLHSLPFQALLDSSGRHVLERWSVSVAPSATALLRMGEVADRRRTEGGKGLEPFLSVGAPEMPPGFSPLDHAKVEAETLAKRFQVEALTGRDATETRVKAEMTRARRIHIATHGKVDEASPLYSFVVLARDDANDGLLQARELVDLDLQADLVVLSACETALGKQVRGEGVVGLTWALFAAGAPATLLSQWQVADESTGALMAGFYEALAPGLPFSEALQRSQLRLLREPKRSHPYYWAPFILVGAGRG